MAPKINCPKIRCCNVIVWGQMVKYFVRDGGGLQYHRKNLTLQTHSWVYFDVTDIILFGRAPKYRTKGCSRCWRPKFLAGKWLQCCKNQCSRSRAVNGRAWTPFCVILWGWLTITSAILCQDFSLQFFEIRIWILWSELWKGGHCDGLFLCDWSRHIQESRGPPGPKSPKRLKKVFPGLPAQSVKKVSKKSQMTRKWVKKTTKSVFGDFLDTPGREAREGLFETFWGFRGSGVSRLLYMGIAIVTLSQGSDGQRSKLWADQWYERAPHYGNEPGNYKKSRKLFWCNIEDQQDKLRYLRLGKSYLINSK